jgi:spore maturation protein SpmB
MVALLGFGAARKVSVYEVFVEGAKDGFLVAVRIIPYLVAILVAVGMFRASGALDVLVAAISPVTTLFGLPGEALPMALLRPLSGSGAYGVLASIINDPAVGPDSYVGYLVSTFQGSTETTFYVIAVYFGAVQIKRIRHALWAGLTADLVGIIAAVFICSMLFVA